MIACAGRAARKYRCDRREVDELSWYRHSQYHNALNAGLLDQILVPLEVLDQRGSPLGRIDKDTGVRHLTMDGLRVLQELDRCVTAGTQTHASDGMATLLVTSREKTRELSRRPEIDIQLVAKTEVRTLPVLMPEAPVLAVQKLLARTGLKMTDFAVVKNHNPFAVNDVIFARLMDYDWHKMNTTGSPLVWGHPQGPTLTRVLIEALEEAVRLGGGYVLIFGCAAGDVGIAAVFRVADGGDRR